MDYRFIFENYDNGVVTCLLKGSKNWYLYVYLCEYDLWQVSATSELVAKDEAVASEQAAESQALKDECEADLAEAIPALEAALAALDTLKVIFYNLACFSTFAAQLNKINKCCSFWLLLVKDHCEISYDCWD